MATELRRLVITAAHAGVSTGAVPIGGGAAVVHRLISEWAGLPHLELRVLGIGDRPPVEGVRYERVPVPLPPGRTPADLVRLGELAYARLCAAFERVATARALALAREPGCCVLANDISEGPDFGALAAAGVPVVTLWHVDVVDYFCRFYLAGLAPERAVALHRAWRAGGRHLPRVLRLVFEKQAACVAGSTRHVVPSAPMRAVIERCYPGAGRKVEVVPWGGWETAAAPAEVAVERERLRAEFGLAAQDVLLLTLSRLSPEKGIERLLRALALGERRGEAPAALRLWIAGEAAFMMGARYRRRLERLAARLAPGRVRFVGYAAGARKQALWELADIYVFPSRHESYGLTLAEALRAGLPAITTAHYSAGEQVPREAGVVVPNGPESAVVRGLWEAICALVADPARRRRMGEAARAHACRRTFAQAAARVLDICRAAAR